MPKPLPGSSEKQTTDSISVETEHAQQKQTYLAIRRHDL